MTSAAFADRGAAGPPPVYDIRPGTILTDRPLDDPRWSAAAVAHVAHARPESARTDLRAEARLLFDGDGLHGRFDVEDAGVRCVHEGFGAEVWKDSCVELFVEPHLGRGDMNFEFNAGGAWLASHILNPVRVAPGRFRDFRRLDPRDVVGARVVASLPRRIEPPLLGPTRWRLCFFSAVVRSRHCGRLRPARGRSVAWEFLSLRRRDALAALGGVGAGRRAELSPTPLLRRVSVRRFRPVGGAPATARADPCLAKGARAAHPHRRTRSDRARETAAS